MYSRKLLFTTIVLTSITAFVACKDKTTDPTPTTDPCAGKTLSVTATVTDASKCSSDGKLVVRASGSSGFTFQLNSGSFQADSTFDGLGAGTYTVTAKDAQGCTKAATFTVSESGTKGALFTVVSDLLETKCNQVCHTAGVGGAPKGIFAADCDIVNRKTMIKTKAVDEGMGALNTTEKKQITDWIDAGGTFAD